MSSDVTFFDWFNAAVQDLVVAGARLAKNKEMAPSEFSAVVVKSMVDCVFELLTVTLPGDTAAEVISTQARGAASRAIFGEQAGRA